MKIFDLTHTVTGDMPVYPGTLPPRLEVANTHERDGFKETLLSLFSHTGTHIDAPAHIIKGKKPLDAFPPEQFLGKALVVDCRALSEGEAITVAQLAPYGERVGEVDFLLFCLGWDARWGTPDYFGRFPCIDDKVLELILRGSCKGIGFDTISLDPIASLARHKRLFAEKEIINIENLCNLAPLCGKVVDFACLPLKWQDADGAPARAVAWEK
jgi:kynurenine formamidase